MTKSDRLKRFVKQRTWVAVMALALTATFGGYEFLKPVTAVAASAAPAAPPLDENSVSALLAFDHAMEALAAHVNPAVVNVTVAAKAHTQVQGEEMDPDQIQRFFGPFGFSSPGGRTRPQIEHGLGSGIIVSPDGYIVTNNHVIDGATDIRVTMQDRKVYPAKLIGHDPLTDLAVIKINASGLPSIPWGDSTALKPGQTVLAFGNPFGFRFTVTRGIVSALNRANPYSDDARKPGEFIQTDAAINPGNSGGPLVNARGEVIGINTFLISQTGQFNGMGFAIPAQIARPVINALIKDGKIEHARIGVGISDVSPENAKFFHYDKDSGAVITQVESGSPGSKAGLKVGDIITQVDGKPVTSSGSLQASISNMRPGTQVTLGVMRDGKSISTPVTLAALNDNDTRSARNFGESHGKARWGLGLAEMDVEARDQLKVPSDIKGVVITNVQPGSPADNAGLTRGDIIVEVNRHPVQSVADVQKELSSVPKADDAMVLVWSNGGSSFRVLHAEEASNDKGE